MTAQELMKPRFEIIADYPYNPHKIGSFIESPAWFSSIHQTTTKHTDEFGDNANQENYCMVSDFEKYPHLFRKLNWWENRKIEDMPKKLICKAISNDTEIMEIQEWDMNILVGWLNKESRKCCSLLTFNPEYGYFPVD